MHERHQELKSDIKSWKATIQMSDPNIFFEIYTTWITERRLLSCIGCWSSRCWCETYIIAMAKNLTKCTDWWVKRLSLGSWMRNLVLPCMAWCPWLSRCLSIYQCSVHSCNVSPPKYELSHLHVFELNLWVMTFSGCYFHLTSCPPHLSSTINVVIRLVF